MTQLAQLLQSYADLKSLNELRGSCRTALKGVYFYRDEGSSGRQPLLYQSGIIVVGQGSKEIHLGEQCVRYGAYDYLVIGVPLPLECEAFADDDKPILGLSIDVPSNLLHRLVNLLLENQRALPSSNPQLGLMSESMNVPLQQAFERLATVLHDDLEAEILGPAIVEEIIYRILMGKNGQILFDLARHDGQYARVAKTLSFLHREYASAITVEELAEKASMSVSGFHRAFRQVTAESPLQYLKKVRLAKARNLITEGRRVNDAALAVGYTSPSQFSREFKRHFNSTPKAMTN